MNDQIGHGTRLSTANSHADSYLNLLMDSLTDFHRVDSPWANAMPLAIYRERSAWKRMRNRVVRRVLRSMNLDAVRLDKRTAEARRLDRALGLDWPPYADTMIGVARLRNLRTLIDTLVRDGVPGDLVETGVWRGGAVAFMRAVLGAHGVADRRIWACDSFAGLPPPASDRYPADFGDRHHEFGFLAVSLDEVKANIAKYGLLDHVIEFVPGWFEDTLAQLPCERIALLRLDGDMYGSTMCALEALYPRLSAGGYVIVDDYQLAPCRAAVTDFRRAEGITAPIVNIDGSGAYWQRV